MAQHWKVLDALRGMAILWVLLGHAFPKAAGGWLGLGWIGVDLFFVLSGFLITRILLQQQESGLIGWRGYWYFMRNRILRIFPLYYAFLLCIFVLHAGNIAPYFGGFIDQLPWYILYSSNWGLILSSDWVRVVGLGHVWSLAVEEQFYVIWPLVVGWAVRKRWLPQIILFGIICAVSLRWVFPAFPGVYVLTPMRMDALLAGGAIAWIYHKKIKCKFWSSKWSLLLLFLVVVLIAALAQSPSKAHPLYAQFGFLAFALFFAVLLFQLVMAEDAGQLTMRSIWRNDLLCWLGKYAYGIYLIHYPVLVLGFPFIHIRVKAWGMPFAWHISMLLTLMLIFLLAWLSYHLYEKHFLALKTRHTFPLPV
jgi:peptidoglycan/LPS O-acetylase OafA/YrhL